MPEGGIYNMNSKQVNAATNRLLSFMGDIQDGNLKTLLANMQTMCEYQAEKLRIYEEHLAALTGKARPELTDSDKRRLAQRSKSLNDFLLASIEPTWCVGTIRGWYNSLVGAKYNSVGADQKKRGRKPVSQEIIDMILYLSGKNPDYGYEKIAGTMRHIGYDVCATTVRKVLDEHGIVPDPERRLRGDWMQFIAAQEHVAAATDFATVELLTRSGLEREHILFFMDIGTREVRCGGMCTNPDSNWTTQIARNMCDMWDGFLLGKKYIIHDRDPVFNKRFDSVFESIGITVKKLPPFAPNMNARCENFIGSLRRECLDKLIFSTEGQLRLAIGEYLEYWNCYRPHAGLGGKLINPYPQDPNGKIIEVPFLGGLFHGYRREKVAA